MKTLTMRLFGTQRPSAYQVASQSYIVIRVVPIEGLQKKVESVYLSPFSSIFTLKLGEIAPC